MSLEVHILSHDHEPMIRFALRHYRQFANHVVVHDGGPIGIENSDEDWPELRYKMVRSACSFDIEPWDTAGQLNDELAMHRKNTCWKGSTADWVICVDADELLYFPGGARETLQRYKNLGAAVIRPEGYEMFSDELPPAGGQITDHVKHGARDDKWYAKPVLFSPRLVAESGFGIGAHESRPVLRDGRALNVDGHWPHPDPRALLLHYHQIGPIEHVAARYDATRKRLALINVARQWGNFAPGLQHAQEKRAAILPRLQRVIP